MRSLSLTALLTAIVVATLLAACGGGDSSPKATGTGNDEDYLRAVCAGIDQVSDALVAATSPAEIARVLEDFAATMRAIDPPPDLADYNRKFVAYLEAALDDPTSVVTTSPPLPPDAARRRLASLEPSIPECREPTFFSRGLD
ncbi:hypothetical protein [Tepidiforma sp.]|uniref:hypothetical protein n=1 Tax=Tepidiforma sp. TaxID=2682230 RepID=UPI002ADE5570|nr:hypothetical protein [Tepidiforma sp.]